jgi:hypothetical protein
MKAWAMSSMKRTSGMKVESSLLTFKPDCAEKKQSVSELNMTIVACCAVSTLRPLRNLCVLCVEENRAIIERDASLTTRAWSPASEAGTNGQLNSSVVAAVCAPTAIPGGRRANPQSPTPNPGPQVPALRCRYQGGQRRD